MSKELEALNYIIKEFLSYEIPDNAPNCVKELESIRKALEALEIIKKYTYSGGWSGDYTTEYWKMNQKEIKLVNELFKGVPIKPLSEVLK